MVKIDQRLLQSISAMPVIAAPLSSFPGGRIIFWLVGHGFVGIVKIVTGSSRVYGA